MKKFPGIRRGTVLLLVICMIASLTACSSKKSSEGETKESSNAATGTENNTQKTAAEDDGILNPLGEFPICKEKITLTIGIPQSVNVEDYETNKFTKYLEEKANVDLQFVAFPSKDAGQKLEIMIASGGELPDMLMGFGLKDAAIYNYGSQGYIVPLNEYYQNSSKYIKEVLSEEANSDIMSLITSADGNIYIVPKLNKQLNNEYANRSFINKSWLDKLGLKTPTTTEELYQVLKAFKEQDPNGNGKADEIPMIGSTDGWFQKPQDFLMNAFIYNDTSNRWVVKDGELSVAYNTEEWKQGLIYLNKLCEEELISPLTFTQDTNQLKAMVTDELPTYCGVITAGSASVFGSDDRWQEYEALLPLTGPEGVSWATYSPSMPSGDCAITSTCKYPEVAFRLADFMWSREASMYSRYGESGVDWIPDEKTGGILDTPLAWGSVQNANWTDVNPAYRDYSWSIKTSAEPNSGMLSSDFANAVQGKHPEEIVKKIIYTPEEQETVSDIQSTINTYVNECFVRFMIGDMSIEKDWDGYLKELNDIGLNEYIEISQEAYSRMK